LRKQGEYGGEEDDEKDEKTFKLKQLLHLFVLIQFYISVWLPFE